jgi:hypothetical protein
MRRIWSTLLCLAAALSCLSAFLLLAPSVAHALGLDVWEVPGLLDEISQEVAAQEQMDEAGREAVTRLIAKFAVAEEVVGGHVTVAEAATRFRELDATATERQLQAWRKATPGATDQERYEATVLRFVEQVRSAPPSSAVATLPHPAGPSAPAE